MREKEREREKDNKEQKGPVMLPRPPVITAKKKDSGHPRGGSPTNRGRKDALSWGPLLLKVGFYVYR